MAARNLALAECDAAAVSADLDVRTLPIITGNHAVTLAAFVECRPALEVEGHAALRLDGLHHLPDLDLLGDLNVVLDRHLVGRIVRRGIRRNAEHARHDCRPCTDLHPFYLHSALPYR